MIRKLISSLLTIFVIVILASTLAPILRNALLDSGAIQEEISIAGTGSMYPTFPKGEGKTDVVRAKETVAWPKMKRYPSGFSILGKNLFSYKLSRGDIVEFENEKTKKITKDKYGEKAGFVKRIIGLPGDSIELRDGYVYLNGKIFNEPYTASARSTYGGESLTDCRKITIPESSVFVLGDNRKASLDSRYELGVIRFSDIHYVIPIDAQEEYKKTWRDTKDDLSLANTVTLDPKEFVKVINAKRKEKNLKPYNYSVLLSQSSKRRGKAMIDFNDFSNEATRSGVTLERAIRDSGYVNIIFAEEFTRGFYDITELTDNFLEFPDTSKILLSSEYQDIGLAAVVGEVDKCPVQVIVTHLGGYKPPNYTKQELDSWQSLIDNLEQVTPTWKNLSQSDQVDKSKLNRLLGLLDTRLTNAKLILTRMKSNQWLTDQERKLAESDKELGSEAEQLVKELSGQ